MENFCLWLQKERIYFGAGLILCGLTIWLFGCESKVESLTTPGRYVTRAELTAETTYMMSIIKVKATNLDQQDELRKQILDTVSVIGQTGSVNPTGLLNLILSVGAVSFGLDQRKKLVRANKKNQNSSSV